MSILYSSESVGGHGELKLTISAEMDREFNDIDRDNVFSLAHKIEEALWGETIRLDPKEQERRDTERYKILCLFAGREIFVEEIPNGYCDRYCCKHRPWFVVTTKKGRIKIGWRKRVINIDWSGSIIPFDAVELFKDEDTTMFDKAIHAWGYDKAREYIDRLLLD